LTGLAHREGKLVKGARCNREQWKAHREEYAKFSKKVLGKKEKLGE